MSKEKPNVSAVRIARATIYMARDWHLGNLVPEGAADLCARFLYSYSPKEIHRISRNQSQTFRQYFSALEYITVPGMALHYAVRKMAIEEMVRAGIAAGMQQVVVLAAGFDTLAVRLHREFPQVRFIEVDRAANQTIKQRALMGPWAPGKNLAFVVSDPTRESLEHRLLSSSYVTGVPTLFIAEEMLASMDPTQRSGLFDFVRALGGPGCGLVFSVMERGPNGKIVYRGATWLARTLWRLQGRRFNWGPSRVELEEYLAEHGLALTKLLTAKDFRVHFLDGNRDVPLAEGEDVAIAHVMKVRPQVIAGAPSKRRG
jgi:methyltransferase (TIGR00027 family)